MVASEGGPAGMFEAGAVVADRYEILEVIGQGTTGVVYRARDLHVDSPHEIVALKAIHPHLHSDRQIFGRFRREVKILHRLEGPHLCKLLEFVEERGLLLIALEYVDGPSLDEYLASEGPPSTAEIAAIMRQICNALTTAHEAGVVHRDLKPSNVLIEGTRCLSAADESPSPRSFLRDLKVRVVDFGLAKLVHGDTTSTMLTEQDMIFGTPDYMAPEQVSGEELDSRCDIYAAGIILYQMVVGKLPFDMPNPITTMAAHLNAPIPTPRSASPERDISAELEAVVLKALAKERDERFGSASELAAALEDAVFGKPLDGVPLSSSEAVTQLEVGQTSLSTTMPSHGHDELAASERKGTGSQVVVKEADSSVTPRSPKVRQAPLDATTLGFGGRHATSATEQRVWKLIAVAAALAAIVLGIVLGVK